MELELGNNFKDFDYRLKELDPKVRNKAVALANGMMSVYGFTKAYAIEEGIKRAEERFGNR